MSKELRINDEITAPVVRVIENGVQIGILPIKEALERAAKAGFDLVEVAPMADPPVCRIMDYGKFRYQQSKKLQDAKKSQTIVQVKEIRLRPKTEEHDLQVKIKHIKKFLEEKNKVKINMIFRGREIVYTDIGRDIMKVIEDALTDVAVIEQPPRLEGRSLTMVVAPKKEKKDKSKG
ncbi:MAG: translation initiation factor IF-3 [Syntrophales bacterium]|nr:translation initiation factor IF-3 [Syntrophales bacterium]